VPDLVGVDGCALGWVWVLEHAGAVRAGVAADAHTLFAMVPTSALVGIDIPMGLPERGPREADRLARQMLGPRGASIFPAPVRAVLEVRDYAHACALHEKTDGRRMSRQAFNLLPKIREVDACLQHRPHLRERVFEVHPETSFAAWAGAPLRDGKATGAGRRTRAALVEACWPGALARVSKGIPPRLAVDLIDAFAALWSVKRLQAGTATLLPAVAPRDAVGMRMQLVV